MDANGGKKCSDLQLELENARDTLLVLNDSIRRIVGRTKHVKDGRSDKVTPYEAKQYETDNLKNRSVDSSTTKKGSGGNRSVFKRLSSPSTRYVDELKPRLTSRVIRELPSRQDIVNAQCADSESRARNRRMFGSLLGTLHKFCQEESRLKQKEEKKAQIEKKLEQQEIIERESLKKERQSLFYYRKRKQLEIKTLEKKISRVKDFETWEASMSSLKPFIKTKTSPSIYFKPKILTLQTQKLQSDCEAALSKIISDKKAALSQELNAMEEELEVPEIDMDDNSNIEKDDKMDVSLSPDKNKLNHLPDKAGKSAPYHKENKCRSIHEPTLNSSIVVVNSDACHDFR
ncbi:pinin [Stomoxys calcitrans]|uniref:Pinin/SDK/MemA protein domain-containing protein n=1 Tax=Stomoxys calcitrans TaxID=35570 RepID=A0A1I8PZC3_STOCA|nr:pinin [Stomoxys calcitrans]